MRMPGAHTVWCDTTNQIHENKSFSRHPERLCQLEEYSPRAAISTESLKSSVSYKSANYNTAIHKLAKVCGQYNSMCIHPVWEDSWQQLRLEPAATPHLPSAFFMWRQRLLPKGKTVNTLRTKMPFNVLPTLTLHVPRSAESVKWIIRTLTSLHNATLHVA